jgi:predicted nucleic acid-binding Zn ribbon protein
MDEGPENLKEILSRMFAGRGWGRRQARLHLEKAWESAIGPESAAHTRLSSIRRGVMEIEVDNAVLMQELAMFHKRKLLAKLRELLKNTTLNDLKFKAGNWRTQ